MPETTGKAYKLFTTEKHPDYKPDYWAICRALCSGDLFRPEQEEVLKEILFKRNAENDDDYTKRRANAIYKNYAGAIHGKLVATVFREQPMLQPAEDDKEKKPDDATKPRVATPDEEWYAEWFKDVSKPGGEKVPVNKLLRDVLAEAFKVQSAWALVDLPNPKDKPQPQNFADQEKLGLLRAYVSLVAAESVWDWEEDDSGELIWALLAFQRQRRFGLDGSRNMVEEEFVVYTQTEFARYKVEYPKGQPPKPDEIVPLAESGPHSFGRVPLVRLRLPDELFVMGKLESLARGHMNLSNSLHWSTINSLFPTPTAFEDDSPTQGNPSEVKRQKRSPYHIVVLKKGEDFRFIGPSPEPFAQAAAQENSLRDEMYRELSMMADSIDNTGAALKRSGESKQADKESESIIAQAASQHLAAFGCELLETVGRGRKEKKPIAWVMKGMEYKGEPDAKAMLDKEQAIGLCDIKSPTYHIERQFNFVKADLGDNAGPDILKKVREELERNNPQEEYDPKAKRERQEAMMAQMQPKPGEQPPPQPGKDSENDDTNNGAAKAAEKE